MRKRACLLLTGLLGVLVAAVPAHAATMLNGTVGPGYTIDLKQGGKKVTRLPAGNYMVMITDKSSAHNFVLSGPGVSREITGLTYQGNKSITVTLRKGTYTYICAPHASSMKGSFTVY